MKRFFTQMAVMAGVLLGVGCIPGIVYAQTSEGPANPAVYACVDNVAGLQNVRWVTALPCVPPLLGTTQEGQPSQTQFTAAYNADGTLAGASQLSGNAADNSSDGVYTIIFKSAFASVPRCSAVLIGANSSDFQIEVSDVSVGAATVAIQSNEAPFDAAAAAFVLTCSNPQ
jgi:hypothetical protein